MQSKIKICKTDFELLLISHFLSLRKICPDCHKVKAMEISDWRNKYFVMSLSMWHLYSWTHVTEMDKWSTTGFSLQYQSLINQTSDENYGNHQLEYCLDVPTNSQNSDVKRNEGQWRRINSLNMVLKWWEWKVTRLVKSTCPKQLGITFFKPCSSHRKIWLHSSMDTFATLKPSIALLWEHINHAQ